MGLDVLLLYMNKTQADIHPRTESDCPATNLFTFASVSPCRTRHNRSVTLELLLLLVVAERFAIVS
jgi:hypothetical protein